LLFLDFDFQEDISQIVNANIELQKENEKNNSLRLKEIYEKLNLLWRRSIAYGYLSLILIKEHKYEEALHYLKQSDEDAIIIKSPYEIGMVFRVKAEIARQVESNKNLKNLLGTYLKEPAEKYCDYGIQLLNCIKSYYEVDILKNLKIN
jgi:hypothetical protein